MRETQIDDSAFQEQQNVTEYDKCPK